MGGMTLQEEVEFLRAENAQLKKRLSEALATTVALERRIAELEGRGDPPPFVKANKPKPVGEKKGRKKRATEHNHARKREEPTRTVEHALDRCPECNYKLRGKSVDRIRQTIELPEPQPIEITEHRMIKRYCPHCEKWRSPKVDFSGVVIGEG
jgi:transposase